MTGQFNPKEKMKGRAQFVICLDGTGSMGPCMDGLKKSLGVFVDSLKEPVDVKDGQAEFAIKEWKGRLLVFRDLDVDGARAMQENPFVTDAEELKAQIAAVEPDGGGDKPEHALDAIFRAAHKSDWEEGYAHVILVFTDAPTKPLHESTVPGGGDVALVSMELKKDKIYLIMLAPKCPEYEELHRVAEMMSPQAAEAWVLKDSSEEMYAYFKDEFNKDQMASLCQVLGKTISVVSSHEVL